MSLLDALKKLNPGDDSHWTTDGLPLLTVVKDLYGSAVTRAQIAEVAPGFTRSKFDELGSSDSTDAELTEVKAVDVSDVVESDEVEPLETEETDSEFSALEKRKAEIQNTINEAKAELTKVVAQMDRIIEKNATHNDHISNMEMIKRFQAQQAKLREGK
ncbi:hypothetical protein vBAcoSR7M_27 [Alteromonas phage vB_AcoS-R7M]|uniref:Uncharacterized protein n=1 Tax=Alteromonas phage vB_AcoS-R7M TaxID=2729541 RepID=A0A6M3YN58_9CAUD|nr:hypothetical protein HWD34_gp27 [Alteromonas phage vB_AcoS-R7M]QJI53349.1 hypothetical protein vBAcoSR7M_27 [Alteromonas phage vB_AcoS-R7M]